MIKIKLGESKQLVKKPSSIRVEPGIFTKLEITKDTKKLLDYALLGNVLEEKEVNKAKNTTNTFFMGLSLNRLKAISEMLSNLDTLEKDIMEDATREGSTPTQKIRAHKVMMERLHTEMNHLKDKESFSGIFQIYNDYRQLSTSPELLENGKIQPLPSDSTELSRNSRFKISKMVNSVLEGVKTNKGDVESVEK